MLFGHTVKYKMPHNVFYRRVFGVQSVSNEGDFWCLNKSNGATAFVPVPGTFIKFGPKINKQWKVDDIGPI